MKRAAERHVSFLNMKRAALERLRTVSFWREHLATHARPIICACDLQPGRFRKSQRVGDCGRPRCWLCHPDKLAGRPTLRDRRDILRLSEGMSEITETHPLLNRTRGQRRTTLPDGAARAG